jgi:choline-sulfatase
MKRLLPFILLALACSRAEVPVAKSPVIIISIDTLRADHLPAYGYTAVKTPAIDALRADAILYDNAYAHAPTTLPSHVSMLTGLLPYEHGVRNNLGYALDGSKHDSIPAMLKRAGYATGAAVSAYVLRGETGVGPLFDFYDDEVGGATGVSIGEVMRDGAVTTAAATRWIGERKAEPFFFFLHLFEPHWPYAGSYDEEIARADAIVGTFLADLKSRGLYDDALIILLSDHGEGLGDHGEKEHGVFVYRETIRVPLLVKLPGNGKAGTSVAGPVQLIDVAPTVAALTGAKPRAALRGSSLLETPEEPRTIYSETMLPRIHFGWSELRSLVDDRHHFIEAPSVELYDLASDAGEKKNVASAQRRVLAAMREEMKRHAADFTAPSNVDAEEAGKLAALGYIGQTRDTPAGALADPKERIGDVEELKSGSALERRGTLREAAGVYESIVARNPQFADAWLRLANVQEQMGADDAAVESYRKAIAAAPVLAPQTALALGALYLRLGRLDDAASHARLALRTQQAAAHHLLGRIALERRDGAAAEREARAAMSDSLYRGPGTVLLARIRIEQRRFAEALTILDELRASSGTPVRDLEATRGDALAMMDRGAEAETAFRTEIAAFPQNSDAYTKLAILYFAMGRARDSDRALREMVAKNPGARSETMANDVRRMLAVEDRPGM